MNVLVVYESWFGTTQQLAAEIADALRSEGEEAAVVSVDTPLPPLEGIDLLVLGAPTHIHGMSSAASRQSAIDQAKGTASEPGAGVRGWLEELPTVEGVRAAVFDTRLDKPALIVGSAAKKVAKRLQRHGFELVAPPESFFVAHDDGKTTLEPGEIERASEWARGVHAAAVADRERGRVAGSRH